MIFNIEMALAFFNAPTSSRGLDPAPVGAARRRTAQNSRIAKAWQALRRERPALRPRDAAVELGVSEAELVATMVGESAVRLDGNAEDLLHALGQAGRCVALTRNAHAISEVRGFYGGVDLAAQPGRVAGDRIDLRVFLDHWRSIFALDEPDPKRSDRRIRSIHVFDRTGGAVHEIFLHPRADPCTWDAIVATRTIAAPLAVARAPARRRERSDASIDRRALLAGWDAMQDSHDVARLLAEHRASPGQALRLLGESRARAVRNTALERILRGAAAAGDELAIAIGNRGCLQMYSGPVKKIVRSGAWLNVLDPGLTLHIQTERVASSWVVARPSRRGLVCSLELLDERGETIAAIRKRDDRSGDAPWRTLRDCLAATQR